MARGAILAREALLASRTLVARLPVGAGLAGRPTRAFGSLWTLGAGWAPIALGSLRTLRAGVTRLALRPGQAADAANADPPLRAVCVVEARRPLGPGVLDPDVRRVGGVGGDAGVGVAVDIVDGRGRGTTRVPRTPAHEGERAGEHRDAERHDDEPPEGGHPPPEGGGVTLGHHILMTFPMENQHDMMTQVIGIYLYTIVTNRFLPHVPRRMTRYKLEGAR